MAAKNSDAGSQSLNRGAIRHSTQMRPSELQIRLATPQDAGDISSILHAAFLAYRPRYTDGGFAATVLEAQEVELRMREGPVWIASRDGKNVATVSAVQRTDLVYIRGMAVLPSARGSGAGSSLLKCAEQWAADSGFGRVALSTTPFLHDAIRLYESSGYVRIEQDPQDLFGTPLFTMEKLLP